MADRQRKKTAPFARVLGDAEPSNMASRTSMASKSGKISWVMEVSENGELKPFLVAIDYWISKAGQIVSDENESSYDGP